MRFICSCGRPGFKHFNNFKISSQCRECGREKTNEKNCLSYEEVNHLFEDNNCILITNFYVGARQKIDFICSCGTKDVVIFSHFRIGARCKDCWKKRIGERFSHSYEYMKQYFQDQGCILLTQEYSDNKAHFKNNRARCKECGNKKQGRSKVLTFEFVNQEFEDAGLPLISTINTNQNEILEYLCKCGKPSFMNYNNFKFGQRQCYECRNRNNSGENNPIWNPDIDRYLPKVDRRNW